MNALLYRRKSKVSPKTISLTCGLEPGFLVGDKTNTELLRHLHHDLAKIAEGLHRSETVGLQDKFGFAVRHLIQGARSA